MSKQESEKSLLTNSEKFTPRSFSDADYAARADADHSCSSLLCDQP
jgi:hypothetical protein